MNDKAPEKVYYIGTEKFGFWTHEPKDGENAIAYIREDLTLDARLKEPGAIKVDHIPDAEKMVERRREMFEKAAFAILIAYKGIYTVRQMESRIIEECDSIIELSDKYAKGEK